MTPEGPRQVGLLLNCGEEATYLGALGDGFFTGTTGEGWENSVALDLPSECTHLVVAVLTAQGELISYGELRVRRSPPPVGDFARAVTP
jgi:hypothetical protein